MAWVKIHFSMEVIELSQSVHSEKKVLRSYYMYEQVASQVVFCLIREFYLKGVATRHAVH